MESFQAISNIPESQESLFFGELLVAKGLISRDELLNVLNQQRDQGGRLGEVLLRVAENYEKASRDTVSRIVSLFEPAMILVMGIVVGFIVISMMMAIFSMNDMPF